MANEASEKDTDELRKRRERLEALKSKRSAAPAPTPEPTAAPASDAADPLAGFGGGAAMGGGLPGMGGEGQKRQRQRKMLMKVFKVLTQTPEDEHGRVPDTPFTQSGVARLMELLQARSADPQQPGAKVAEGLLNFIKPGEDEEATSSGASIAKLQTIARRIESFRGKGGGAGRGASW